MGFKKLSEKVKLQQEKIQTIAKTARMRRNLWVENADRLVAGFLEMFEEGCHNMGTAIKSGLKERLTIQKQELAYDPESASDVDDDEEDVDDEMMVEEYSKQNFNR